MKFLVFLLLPALFTLTGDASASTKFDCYGDDYDVKILNFEPSNPVATTQYMIVKEKSSRNEYICLKPDQPYFEDTLFYQCTFDESRRLSSGKKWSYMWIDVDAGQLQLNYDIFSSVDCE